jgi:hypothetical protein
MEDAISSGSLSDLEASLSRAIGMRKKLEGTLVVGRIFSEDPVHNGYMFVMDPGASEFGLNQRMDYGLIQFACENKGVPVLLMPCNYDSRTGRVSARKVGP